MTPKISVVMPVWNAEAYLAAAIDSLLGQTFTDFELIVVDDGSTDRTGEILATYDDPRLTVSHLNHGGIVTALNHGVAQASADWIARQDADDVSLPHRFEAQWQTVQRHADTALCYTDIEIIGGQDAARQRVRFPKTKSLLALRLCYQCPFAHSTVLFKKSAFIDAGGYRPEERHAEDYALWGRLLERGELHSVSERLVQFRVHPLSVSKQNLSTQLALTREIGVEHCRRFMTLESPAAERAQAILAQSPRKRAWGDWLWFLTHCAPRLRWKSYEASVWLIIQTLRGMANFSRTTLRSCPKV